MSISLSAYRRVASSILLIFLNVLERYFCVSHCNCTPWETLLEQSDSLLLQISSALERQLVTFRSSAAIKKRKLNSFRGTRTLGTKLTHLPLSVYLPSTSTFMLAFKSVRVVRHYRHNEFILGQHWRSYRSMTVQCHYCDCIHSDNALF